MTNKSSRLELQLQIGSFDLKFGYT